MFGLPSLSIRAYLQPVLKPGSKPKISFPFRGGYMRSDFKFFLKTSKDFSLALSNNSFLISFSTLGLINRLNESLTIDS